MKKPIDLDALDAGGELPEQNDDELEDLGDLLSKKKKKKKKAFNLDDLENALPEADKARDAAAEAAEQAEEEQSNEVDLTLADGDLDFNLPLKKKKKKKVVLADPEALDESVVDPADEQDKENLDDESAANGDGQKSGGYAWLNSDRDYTYDELLDLVFNIIKEKNPDIVAGEKRRLVMRPPQVLRVGTKKSSFANFIDICKS